MSQKSYVIRYIFYPYPTGWTHCVTNILVQIWYKYRVYRDKIYLLRGEWQNVVNFHRLFGVSRNTLIFVLFCILFICINTAWWWFWGPQWELLICLIYFLKPLANDHDGPLNPLPPLFVWNIKDIGKCCRAPNTQTRR